MLKTEKSRYLDNAMTDRHEIRQSDAKALNPPCAEAMRPFVKLLFNQLFIYITTLKYGQLNFHEFLKLHP